MPYRGHFLQLLVRSLQNFLCFTLDDEVDMPFRFSEPIRPCLFVLRCQHLGRRNHSGYCRVVQKCESGLVLLRLCVWRGLIIVFFSRTNDFGVYSSPCSRSWTTHDSWGILTLRHHDRDHSSPAFVGLLWAAKSDIKTPSIRRRL